MTFQLPAIPSYYGHVHTLSLPTHLTDDALLQFVANLLDTCRIPYDTKANVFKLRVVQASEFLDAEVSLFRTTTENTFAVDVRRTSGSAALAVALKELLHQSLRTKELPACPVHLTTGFGPVQATMAFECPPLTKEEAAESIKPLLLGLGLGLDIGNSSLSLDTAQTICRLLKSDYSLRLLSGSSDLVEALVDLLNPEKKVSLETRIFVSKALSMILTANAKAIEASKQRLLEWIATLSSEPTSRYNFYLKEFLEEVRRIL